jgi:hypothetical protein
VVATDGDRVAAAIVGAINQQTAHVAFAHFGFYLGGCKSPRSQRPRSLECIGSSYAASVVST